MDAVQSVTPNVIFTGYIFPTWKDQIPIDQKVMG
jgi:hypothetical protein